MMRNSAIFAFAFFLLSLCLSPAAQAQVFSVSAENIITLARAVTAQAHEQYALPTAYGIGIDNNHYILTLPMLCETFARTIDALNPNSPFQPGDGPFPKRLSGLAWDWKGPDPVDETTRKRNMIPVLASDTAKAAYALVQSFNGKTQPKIHARWKTRNQELGISAAQLVVAMAVYVEKRFSEGPFPEDYSYAIPDVISPRNWEDLQNFIQLDTGLLQAENPVVLQVTVNGQVIPSNGTETLDPLFSCGPISLRVNAEGPVRAITVTLGKRQLQSFEGNGSFAFAFDSMDVPDGDYPLTVTVTRTHGDDVITASRTLRIINGTGGYFHPQQ